MPKPASSPSGEDTQDDSGFHSGGDWFTVVLVNDDQGAVTIFELYQQVSL